MGLGLGLGIGLGLGLGHARCVDESHGRVARAAHDVDDEEEILDAVGPGDGRVDVAQVRHLALRQLEAWKRTARREGQVARHLLGLGLG